MQDKMAQHEQQLKYWTKQLEGSHPAELFCDKPRPTVLSGEAGEEEVTIVGSLYGSLQEFCTVQKATRFAVLLSAFRATQFRLTGAEDATIGFPIANQNQQEVESLTGIFANLHCIRSTVQDDSFESLVQQVQSTATTAFENRDVPFENIVSALKVAERDAFRKPLVQITVAVYSKQDFDYFGSKDLQVDSMARSNRNQFDLELYLYETVAGFRGSILYAKDLFYPETIKNMVSVFYEILRQGLNKPHTPIAWLPLSSCFSYFHDSELLRIKRTDYPRESSVVDVFRQQALACPSTVAVKDATTRLTYSELDQQSDWLSQWLANQGLEAETLIGVFIPRSCQTIVAFLGILKAKLAYLPLDVSAPSGRIKTILSSVQGYKLLLFEDKMPIPAGKFENVQVVRIAEALQEQSLATNHNIPGPLATNLAYVMFTSGSTGKPKGVMVEHRSIIRLVKQPDITSHLTIGTAVAHIANIAFDASTWEIYTALLNGGTLVCFDNMAVLDIANISNGFIQEDIRIAKFTPALLQQCLTESPSMFNSLDILLSAGDRLHPQVAQLALNCTSGRVINTYGPTENTGHSTWFSIPRDKPFTKTVPIGRAICNSGAVVMDSRQRIVPVGFIGELVVTGDGLARGYLEPQQNQDRFIDVLIGGELVRAYRTGDYVRWRPVDGNLEFFGRMDGQVKIRGHRVELGEIEHALLSNGLVSEAVALVQNKENIDRRLVAFVTLRPDHGSQAPPPPMKHNAADEVGEVNAWTDIRKAVTYADVDSIGTNELGRDFIGWNSMYNGHEIDKEEMHVWLQDTLKTILNGCEPGHVLEIGTGTGMILFGLGEGLKSYFGLEPVETVADFVAKMAGSIPQLADKVKVQVGTATDVDSLRGFISPTTVVVNSVAQYFPSPEYLQSVIADLLQLKTASYLFFGDIRSYALYDEFQVTMAMHRFGTRPSTAQLRQSMEQIKQSEKELLIDPAFFTALKMKYPHLVEHVEILPKRVKFSNELSCYRYAAVVHTNHRTEKSQKIYSLDGEEWINFVDHDMDGESLLDYLQQNSSSSIVAISNIPHSKTFLERCIVESLSEGAEISEELIASFNQSASRSLSADDLSTIAEKAGFEVELSWARQFSQRGGLDAVFHHTGKEPKGRRLLFQFPTDHENRPSYSFTNRPLQFRLNRIMERQLKNDLQTQLPSYMVPTAIKVLDKMPTNENRKIDRHALAKITELPSTTQNSKGPVAPRNDIECTLCEEFAAVLGVDVGITDNFFDLGGHSLMATRLVSRINKRMDCGISVFELYKFTTPATLCKLISPDANSGTLQTSPRYLHHHSRPGSKATIVLVHGFWGQGNLFLPLVPLLDDHFDVILVHDPFFGKLESPTTIIDWARYYMNDLGKIIKQHLPVILGGYSFGGLIAFEMASLWRDVFGSDLASILLLDAASYPSTARFLSRQNVVEQTINLGLAVFGEDQKPMVYQHFKKLRSLLFNQIEQHTYGGNCLYLVTPEACESKTADWWKAHCPKLYMRVLDCGHYDVLGPSMVGTVAQIVNEYYRLLV